ncbi:hypothetical protein L9F63_011728, partial [Diploptera punctata]
FPPQQQHPISPHGPAGHWVSPGPPPVMETPCHQYAGAATAAAPVPTYSWDIRPKDLRLSSHVTLEKPPVPATSTAADVELNGTAIKERLMANRLPESCV